MLLEKNDHLKFETRSWVFQIYGTCTRSMYTVFGLTMSGCWPTHARLLVEEVHPGFALFFSVYASFVVFAVTRIISALCLRDTLAVAASDATMVARENLKK